jgi:hypothetical protein
MALAPYQFQLGEPIFYFLSKHPKEIIEPSVEGWHNSLYLG